MAKLSLSNITLISFAGICLLICATEARPDCRKFVFAPSCRGVAAKRDDGSSPDKASDKILMSSSDISAMSRLSPSLLASRLLLMSDQSYENFLEELNNRRSRNQRSEE